MKDKKTEPARNPIKKGLGAGGRPRVAIDVVEFEKLCQLQCTKEEIAGWYCCSEDTIERWCKDTYGRRFAEVFAEKRVGGLISLRRSQFRLAEKNAAMAIFLGKNYLGQKDTVEADFNPESLKRARELLEGVESVID